MRRRVLLAVFLLALALRLLHVFQLHTAPVFDMRLGDSAVYDRWAREIAAGDWIGQGVFWYAPLYPYLLGAVYAAFGTGPLAVRLLQAGLGAASCAVLAWAAARLFAPRAGIAAGLLLAVFAPAIFYDALLHRPVLELFLMSVVVAVVSAGSGRTASPRFAAALGVASGLLVLARENTLSFVPLFALLLLVRPWAGGRGRTIPALVYVLAVALVLSPVALRNRLVGGELHLTAANFGDNFYKGNHPGADGWYVPLRPSRGTPALERADATALAERELGRALSPSEISRYWTGRALQFIRSHPGDWLRLLAKKTFLVWHRTELGDTEDLYTFATWSDVLRATNRFAHFGLLAPLGLLGLWVTARRARTLWPLYAMLVIYPASVVLFYVFGRYRYPVVAVLVPFAGAAITESASFFRAAGALKRIACVLSVVAALVACNWPTGAEERVRAATLHNIGVWLARTPEQAAQAIGYYEQALRLEPHSALTLYWGTRSACGAHSKRPRNATARPSRSRPVLPSPTTTSASASRRADGRSRRSPPIVAPSSAIARPGRRGTTSGSRSVGRDVSTRPWTRCTRR